MTNEDTYSNITIPQNSYLSCKSLDENGYTTNSSHANIWISCLRVEFRFELMSEISTSERGWNFLRTVHYRNSPS